MAKQRTSNWIWFLFGIPALLRAWTRWDEHPWSGWFYMSAASGVVLVALGVVSILAERKRQATARCDTTGEVRQHPPA
jgi:hypothetical protein